MKIRLVIEVDQPKQPIQRVYTDWVSIDPNIPEGQLLSKFKEALSEPPPRRK